MKLQSVAISHENWGDFKGRYTGTLRFSDIGGEITINLDPDTSDKILAIVAGQLIQSASTVAGLMREDVKRLVDTRAR